MQETADLLKRQGKMHWVVLRDEKIHAKGKGELETYWLDLKIQSSGSARSGQSGKSGGSASSSNNMDLVGTYASVVQHLETNSKVRIDSILPPKIQRLVKWNADVLLRILKQVVARREANEALANEDDSEHADLGASLGDSKIAAVRRTSSPDGKTCIDEVEEIIELPKFNAKAAKIQKDANDVELSAEVVQQLHDFITVIASMYRAEVPFHK